MLPNRLLANMIYCWKFGNLPTIEDWHLDAVLVVLLPKVWCVPQKLLQWPKQQFGVLDLMRKKPLFDVANRATC